MRAHIHTHVVTQSVNHAAAAQCIKLFRYRSLGSVHFNIRIEEKCDLSDFDCIMAVGARKTDLTISETAQIQGLGQLLI